MKFCKKCGSEIEDNTVFCPNCGENITLINGTPQEIPSENSNTQEENDFDKEKEIQKEAAKSKRKDLRRSLIVIVVLLLIGGAFGAILELNSDYQGNSSGGSKSEYSSNVTQRGDTSGTVSVNYCMMDLQTYYTLSQLNIDFRNSNYIEIGDMSWENTYTTVSSLVGWYGAELASKQQVNPQSIKLFNAIAYGSSATNEYQLVALYINGKAATLDTYLYDGDEIQAVVVYSY